MEYKEDFSLQPCIEDVITDIFDVVQHGVTVPKGKARNVMRCVAKQYWDVILLAVPFEMLYTQYVYGGSLLCEGLISSTAGITFIPSTL